jgi:hypothetical protein
MTDSITLSDRWNGIDTPDDVPEPPDFDAAADRADLDNDSGAPRTRYLHKPMTREQIDAAIARIPMPRLSVRQAS